MTGSANVIAILAAKRAGDGKLYDFTEHKEKRSRSQNSYYWELLGRLSRKLRKPMAAVHNEMLRSYGVPEIIDGGLITVMVPDSEIGEARAIMSESYHLKPTSRLKTGNDGNIYRMYMLLKSSHDMNTEEMSGLLNGLIEECKAQDIETLPPDELERLRRLQHD